MLSLSDNEFSVLSFLVRNFTERLTIRNIAQRLNFSPAGVFNILKKLEKHGIVNGQRFGTGLFYSINFESKIAGHLAEIVLLYSEEKIDVDIEKLKSANAAIIGEKTLILVTDSITTLDVSIPGVNAMVKTEDEIIDLLRKKDPQILRILKNGIVLFGEDKFIGIIKKCSSGF